MASDYVDDLEENLLRAIQCLESERFYSFSFGLMELLNHAKHCHRLLHYSLEGVSGTDINVSNARLNRATAEDDWYRHE